MRGGGECWWRPQGSIFSGVFVVESESSGPLGPVITALSGLTEELRRANVIQYYRVLLGQLDRAIDDPSLAAALSTVDDVSPDRRRQLIFANKQYTLILLGHLIGVMSRGELLGALRVLSRNPVFRDYWERTAAQRGDLPEDSLEARIGRAVDAIMADRFDEVEEWWVADSSGVPPVEVPSTESV